MKAFLVTVKETTLLTYTIEAKTKTEARRLWESRDERRGEPDEDLLDHELLAVVEAPRKGSSRGVHGVRDAGSSHRSRLLRQPTTREKGE